MAGWWSNGGDLIGFGVWNGNNNYDDDDRTVVEKHYHYQQGFGVSYNETSSFSSTFWWLFWFQ